jgi:hypothetical protein
MIDFTQTQFHQVVIDETTYHKNQTDIEAVWDNAKFRYHFLGIQYLNGYSGQVFVWLIPTGVAQHYVQALTDDITYFCMEQDVA